jgi:hypothetical protein
MTRFGQAAVGLHHQSSDVVGARAKTLIERAIQTGFKARIDEEAEAGEQQRHRGREHRCYLQAQRGTAAKDCF